jgi:aryl-alcohol dehydrogenase-like predicted oxidoreductase
MQYRSLGRSGMKVSPICLGTFNFANPTSEEDSIRLVERAVAAGINFLDTSNNYTNGESERILGRAISRIGNRHSLVVATKAHFPVGPGPNDSGNSRLHLVRACEDSLKRLGTDYVDLYQLHRASFDIPIDETLGALTDLVRQGKIRYIGCSTFPSWKVMESLMVSELKNLARFISEQPPYNLLDRRIENELVPLCKDYGIGIIPYAPMAQGVLAGRYNAAVDFPPDSRAGRLGGVFAGRVNQAGIEIGRQISALARDNKLLPAQLSVLWVKDQPGITAPIFGPRTLDQLDQILPVLDMSLSEELRLACDKLVPPGSAVTNFHNGCTWMKQQLLGLG